jgi:hypothetical protein|tara:strand:+ start:408 stop:671 length:264 start_codon:yes stop_codon:yes gene_type:complete
MLKELKILIYIFTIVFIFFLTMKYYVSDTNKKNIFRSLTSIDEKIDDYANNLLLLRNDTENIAIYVEKTKKINKKSYNFWNLLNNND